MNRNYELKFKKIVNIVEFNGVYVIFSRQYMQIDNPPVFMIFIKCN